MGRHHGRRRGGDAWCAAVFPRPGGGAGATLTALGLRRPKSSQEEESAPQSTRFLRAFWHRAYEENVTGLAGMVAYNLVLFLFPFALLVLFIFGQILQSPSVEANVLTDLQRLFPAVETSTLDHHPRAPRPLRRRRRRRRARVGGAGDHPAPELCPGI